MWIQLDDEPYWVQGKYIERIWATHYSEEDTYTIGCSTINGFSGKLKTGYESLELAELEIKRIMRKIDESNLAS